MKALKYHQVCGSTLVMTMILLAVLAMSVAGYYRTLIPKYRSTYHSASWHEALHMADGGVDYVLDP